MLHCCCMGMVQSYSLSGANVHCHLTHASLDPPEFTSQTTSQSIQLFLQSSRRAKCGYTSQRATPSPSKLPPSHWGIWTPSNTRFLGPTRVQIPNGIPVGSAIFAGITIMTDRQTNKPLYSICNKRLHLHT